MFSKVIVLDANIIIRAILGNKVRTLITDNLERVDFFTPEVCIADAHKYLPLLFEKRTISVEPALMLLNNLTPLLHIVDELIYQGAKEEAQLRIKNRDIRDWPIVATALTLNCPIWTEDQDFFGTGISTWTTDRVHLFFEDRAREMLFSKEYY
jgi:predicted nucleic acid-binding protein